MKSFVEKKDREVMKELRTFRNISYRELAAKMGCSHGWIQQVETGKFPITEDFKTKLLESLSLSLRDWDVIQGTQEDVVEMKLECIERVYKLTPMQIQMGLVMLRNLSIALVADMLFCGW